jgi:predicted nucleic-acid-binding protein
MIAVDTNVLVRLIAKDDAEQYALAKGYLKKHSSADAPAFINRVVLVELAWVLQSLYEYKREEITVTIDGLLSTVTFRVEEAPDVRLALGEYRNGGIDFADALIAATNLRQGAKVMATFDKTAAKRLHHFEFVGN